jgi:hypothetical protein
MQGDNETVKVDTSFGMSAGRPLTVKPVSLAPVIGGTEGRHYVTISPEDMKRLIKNGTLTYEQGRDILGHFTKGGMTGHVAPIKEKK